MSSGNNKENNSKCWYCGKSPKDTKYSYETGGEKRINTKGYGDVFKCNLCGYYFCEEHHLPEKHDCSGLLLKMKIRNNNGKLEYSYSNLMKSDSKSNQNIKDKIKLSGRKNYPINSKSDEARISYRKPTPITQKNEIEYLNNPSLRNWILNNIILLLMVLVIIGAIVYYLFIYS
ncbi:AN1-type zinc finger domain-containing protein [Methanohalophilus portucalensis]|uniref:AN1-like Zinc finger n=2 Tax=Methanohalophilus portucalensis TaxID=39664 RepID=A0A1L9C2S1_9EURY|nr:zinc finger AN1 domain-containing stress-associated protein [Methanohalophilus portucalensis]ATU08033.1 hypothetical protein BKM01_04125 [Methanohalophilus portucalensis]OJH48771.1 hypothetical protein MPF_1818 [Methanohalophilus portucalensis FDF-1]RNI12246.1 hypothetical protein EFE41_03825 [Methanohalophilus portucalensis FDF-1]SMH43083.1 AN1-like Zinc finger [Methanohalophilus portucalensis FDF-1]